jgi:hypothetical protein
MRGCAARRPPPVTQRISTLWYCGRADSVAAFTRETPVRLPSCMTGGMRTDEHGRSGWDGSEQPIAYSITSSARPSNVTGMLTPSVFADLRLRISSTLVDSWTGRSAGFSPLRMRPV